MSYTGDMDNITCKELPEIISNDIEGPGWVDYCVSPFGDFCRSPEMEHFYDMQEADRAFDAGEFSGGFEYPVPCRANFSLVG